MRQAAIDSATHSQTATPAVDALDRRIIALTQDGLPLVERPYHALAADLGVPVEELMERIRRMRSRGVIRRIGAAPNHYAFGYTANGMSVWDVPDHQANDLGERVGQLDFVSHCYLRPRRLPDWPYNLFAMVHGRSREEVHAKVARIADALGEAVRGYDVLFSTRILKKTGLRLGQKPSNGRAREL